MSLNCNTRQKTVFTIKSAFSHLEWAKARTRNDMNELGEQWVKSYNTLTEDLIGSRLARISSWGRKLNMDIRNLCREASIARAWFVEAECLGRDVTGFFENWGENRKDILNHGNDQTETGTWRT